MRTAAKRDANEPAIIQALERCGWFVRQLSDPDWPDLFIARGGRRELVEVKMPGEHLSGGQLITATKLSLFGVRVYIAHDWETLLEDLAEGDRR